MSETSTSETVASFNQGVRALMRESATGEIMRGFHAMHQAATAPGALSTRVKELLALGIAISTQCDGCVAWHVTNAVKAGAVRDEVLETIGVAIMMGGGPSTYYGGKALDALNSVLTSD